MWQTISLHPLSGWLDTRSRPADVPPGGLRWKQNFAISPTAQLLRRGGHARFYSDAESYANHDYHRQGKPREVVSFGMESTSSDGTRRLFIGTQSTVSVLNPSSGQWTDIVSGKGASGSQWRGAELQDTLILTNNVDDILAYDIVGGGAPSTVGDLKNVLHVSKAKLVIEFGGFILLMNVVQDGDRQMSRVLWSDLNLPEDWDPAKGSPDVTSLAGMQDLDYGDEILAAAPMLGALYIYTRRSIWRVTVSGDADSVFSFNRVYNEPKNQTGCLAYPNTLISTGTEHWYMGRDGVYNYNPYIPTPDRQEWMYRASGFMFSGTGLDSRYCQSPVGGYVPDSRELWFSWPSTDALGVNNWTLVAQVELKTADVVDTGYTMLANFRRAPAETGQCNEVQDFIGASGVDWALKSIGKVFYREYASLADPSDKTVDLPEDANYSLTGYNSILRGLIPLEYADREKIVRRTLVGQDSAIEDEPCVMRLRIGNSKFIVDANAEGDTGVPLWRVINFWDQKPYGTLQAPEQTKASVLQSKNLRTSNDMVWPSYEQGAYLYFELTVTNRDGSPAIGGDVAIQRIDFEAMALPKR